MSYKDDIPEDGFKIADELAVRDLLDTETGWRYQFDKASKYDYDLAVTHWPGNPREPDDAVHVGYVEVERANSSWHTGDIPDHWDFYNFLRRKVHHHDPTLRQWLDLKPHADSAVYLKFNREMDNCFAVPITVIDADGTPTKKSDGTLEDSYLKLDLSHDAVRSGFDECLSFILEYLVADGDGAAVATDGGTDDVELTDEERAKIEAADHLTVEDVLEYRRDQSGGGADA